MPYATTRRPAGSGPRTRVRGTAAVDFLCECAGHPHDTDTVTVEIDRIVVEDGRKDMPVKALKDHFGKPRFREIASYRWINGPTLTPVPAA